MSNLDSIPPEEEEDGGLIEDIFGGIGDAVSGTIGGVLGAGESIANLFGADSHDNFGWGKSEGMVGGFFEGLSSFLTGFIPVAGWVGRGGAIAGTGMKLTQGLSKTAQAGRAAKAARAAQMGLKGAARKAKVQAGLTEIGRAAAAGAVADFAVFDGNEPRLANLIQEYPTLQNPLTEFLATNDDDSEVYGRLKNVVEGMALGVLADVALLGMFRVMKRSNKHVAEGNLDAAAKDKEELGELADDALGADRNELEGEVKGLADPDVEPRNKWEEEGVVRDDAAAQDPRAKPDDTAAQDPQAKPDDTAAKDPQAKPDDTAAKDPQAKPDDATAQDPKVKPDDEADLDVSSRDVEQILSRAPLLSGESGKRVGVDPRGGDVLVVDITDNTSKFMRGTAGFERLKRAPNSRMTLIQLKPREDLRIATANRLVKEKLITRRRKGESVEVYRERAEVAAKENGFDLFEFNDGNHRAVTVLNKSAKLREVNVDSANNFFGVKRAAEKVKDPKLLTPVEKVAHGLGLTEEGTHALAKKIEQLKKMDPEDIDGEQAVKELAGIMNLERQGDEGWASLHQLIAAEDLNLGRHVEGPVTHAQVIREVAESGLGQMLGGRDSNILVEELRISARDVTKASRRAKSAEVAMRVQLTEIKELASQVIKSAREEGEAALKGGDQSQPMELRRLLETMARRVETYGLIASMYGRVRSEFGRGLNAFNISVDQMMDSSVIRAQVTRGGRKRMLAMAKRIEFDAQQGIAHMGGQLVKHGKGPKFWSAFTDYWMFSLLSAPRTLSTNLIGSTAAMMFRPVEKSLGAWLLMKRMSPEAAKEFQRVINVNTRMVRFQAMQLRDICMFKKAIERDPEATQTLAAMKKAFVDNKGVLNRDSSAAFMDFVQKKGEGMSPENIQGILGKEWDKDSGMYQAMNVIAQITRMPSRIMIASDEMVKQVAYQSFIKAELVEKAMEMGLKGFDASNWVHRKMQRFSIQGTAVTEKNARRIAEDRIKGEMFADETSRQLHIDQDVRRMLNDEPEAGFIGPQRPGEHLGELSPLVDKARKYSEEITFTAALDPSRGPLAKLGTLMMDFAKSHPFMVMFTPFIRTPMNILMFTADRLPIPGLNKDFIPMVRHVMSMGDRLPEGLRGANNRFTKQLMGSPEEAADAMGRAATTIGAMGLFGTLAANDILTGGGPRDIDQLKVLKASGWQPYSIKFGDTYVSYQRLDPLAGLLAFFGDMGDVSRWSSDKEGIEDLMYSGFVATLKNIESKSYLSGLTSLVDIVSERDIRSVERLGGRITGNLLVPNAIAAMRGFTDDSMAHANGVMDAAIRRIPFMSDNAMEPQRNFIGEPLQKKQLAAGLKAAEGFAGYFLPIAVNTTSSDLVTKEMADLAYAFSAPGPKRLGVDLRDFPNEAGQSAYDRWQELVGQVKVKGRLLKPAMERLIRSREYQSLPMESLDQMDITSPRIVMLRSLVSKYRRAAQENLMKEYPELQRQTLLRIDIRDRMRRGDQSSDIQALLGQ